MSEVDRLEDTILRSGDASVTLAPARGGMATRFAVGDRAVFYLDEATLLDRTKNVRGGNPVLFPSPGKLAGDRWRHGTMGQHGFARNSAWDVTEQVEDEAALRLRSSDATRAVYPWDFELTYAYRLRGRTLRVDQRIEHKGGGGEAMPFGAGFHPYFRVGDKAKLRVPTPATRAWDNATKAEIALTGPIDLTAKEVDLHLLDHGATSMSLELGDGHRIEVRGSPEYTRWVIWTLEGKDFVCVEPWTAPGDALNTGLGLLHVEPGGSREIWIEIALV